LLDVLGGGNFLRWKGKGTIIDPGVSFLRLFQLYTDYGFGDIDMVLATHDHLDHCQDLVTLISLLRSFNKPPDAADGKTPRHRIDVLLSLGVERLSNTVLTHRDNASAVRWCSVHPPDVVDEIPERGTAPDFGNPTSIVTKYGYEFTPLPAIHTELLDTNTAFGVRIRLQDCGKTIVISGDTAMARDPDSLEATELVNAYAGADLLILHVGSMEPPGEPRLSQHLGLTGIVQVLRGLAERQRPELVVLTEWGYEFGRLGLFGRSRFTELVVRELEDLGCGHYFAATERGGPCLGRAPILPADLGLRIGLPELGIWSEKDRAFFPAREFRAVELGAKISFQHKAGEGAAMGAATGAAP
jgi:hypothetical protein